MGEILSSVQNCKNFKNPEADVPSFFSSEFENSKIQKEHLCFFLFFCGLLSLSVMAWILGSCLECEGSISTPFTMIFEFEQDICEPDEMKDLLFKITYIVFESFSPYKLSTIE